jgi:hypothetical protein
MRAIGVALVAAVLAAPAHASAITDSLLRDKLVGAWAGMGDCRKGALTFNADGTFALTGVDDPAKDLHGMFDVADGRLLGQAGVLTMPVLSIIFTADGSLILGPDLLQRCGAN